jgi:uncharacterized protein involved in outer membrane biogenesis
MRMNQFWESTKAYLKSTTFRKIIKRAGFFCMAGIAFVLFCSGVLAIYFDNHKAEIVNQINDEINQNIKGTIHIGDIKYKFLAGFPNVTLALSQVELKDSLWAIHKRTLLKAVQIEIRLGLFSLLTNEINIDKIEINQATLYLFRGKNGIVNTDVFRSKPKNAKSKSSITSSIDEIVLNQVRFISENQLNNKRFDFDVIVLKSKIKHDNDNWHTDLYLKTLAKSMAFNTKRGSFIKGKMLEGILAVDFSDEKNKISVAAKDLEIGKDLFAIKAHFNLNKNKSPFDITIKTDILWQDASNLMSENISSRISRFDLKKPIRVSCTISGDLNFIGDPQIVVNTKTSNNELRIPDGLLSDCCFEASFTNNYKKGNGCNDANSIITFTNFSATYQTIPFSIPIGTIANFEKTTAAGSFKSDFDISRLNEIINKDFMRFSDGQAKVNLAYKFDIVDLKIQKPLFTGNVSVKNAALHYGPRDLAFQKTDIELNFTEEALFIKKIKFSDRKNTVFMEGKIDNFLTLYYGNPEKMVVSWDVYCPFLDVKQFLGVVTRSHQKAVKKKDKTADFSNKLYAVIDKCQMVLNLKADKLVYSKMEATKAKATVLLVNNKLIVKNGWVQNSGGTISFDGQLMPKNNLFFLESNVKINQVGIAQFLTAVNNFGIQSFKPKNIKGYLSASAAIKGTLLSGGQLKTNSLAGTAKFDVSKGALVAFEPLKKIGKFAFPFRDVDNIVFSDLSGDFVINGDLVHVNYLKVSSSVVNLDINGVYSFNGGTNLALTIPLRNPKKDVNITDKNEIADRRNKGIVLYLVAIDEGGKIKIKWNKSHEK